MCAHTLETRYRKYNRIVLTYHFRLLYYEMVFVSIYKLQCSTEFPQ